MNKVTINKKSPETPTQEIVRNSQKTFIKEDALGRKILIKMPSFQDSLRYDLYFGKFDETNKKFYESNKFLLFIKEIDGSPVAFPTNEAEALALSGRLDNEGMAAVMECIAENFSDKLSNEVDENEEKRTLKK